VLVHEHFENLARKELKLLGIEDSSNIVIAYPADRPVTDSAETVLLKAREQVEKLEDLLTSQKWQPSAQPARAERTPPQRPASGTRTPPEGQQGASRAVSRQRPSAPGEAPKTGV
jgi:hypothetical protein